MVLKGYFDGGNQADSTQCDRITLAAACGTVEEWDALDAAWKDVLISHKAPFLHTTDAIGLHKAFAPKKGWNDDRVDAFISGCVDVIEQHLLVPGRLFSDPAGVVLNIAKPGLNIFTFTVPLKDYQEVRKRNPKLPTSCTEVCTTETLGIVFRYGRRLGIEAYELYFDQGEPFYGHMYDRRHNKKSRKHITPMSKVVALAEVNMKVYPALQVADLFAWCINHVNDVRREWHRRLNRLSWDALLLDYKRLLKPIPGALERTAAWNLPTRRLDR